MLDIDISNVAHCTPLGPITIANRIYNKILDRVWFSARLFVA